MKPRHQRFLIITAAVAALAIAGMFVLNAFQSNLVFFFTPTQVS
ncbi:MAG: cytochrome c biogenesis protein CcmE, partial [Betaproteobacteria bacterium]|nr:cytochrome c biogenesis protein CcmE [Betaproteobacteria bacterium]